MNAVDTNILVYVHDNRDVTKQRVAAQLVETLEDGVLLWQVACEYLNVSRRMEVTGHGLPQAFRRIQYLRRMWYFIEPQEPVIDLAMELLDRYSLSFWDSLIAAACLNAGVERLYTEDFDAYPRIGDLEIVNPFDHGS